MDWGDVGSGARVRGETLDELAADLIRLRERTGAASYAEIARRITVRRVELGQLPDGAMIPRSTVYHAFSMGRSRIDAELVRDIVLALGETPERADDWVRRCGSARKHATGPGSETQPAAAVQPGDRRPQLSAADALRAAPTTDDDGLVDVAAGAGLAPVVGRIEPSTGSVPAVALTAASHSALAVWASPARGQAQLAAAPETLAAAPEAIAALAPLADPAPLEQEAEPLADPALLSPAGAPRGPACDREPAAVSAAAPTARPGAAARMSAAPRPAETARTSAAPRRRTGLQRARFIALALLGCLALNLVGQLLVALLHLPVYLDMIGTAVAALAFGPLAGVAVGLATNGIGIAVSGAVSLPFALVNIAGALVWAYGVRRFGGGDSFLRFFSLTLAVAVACSLVAAPILAFGFAGITGHGSENVVRFFAHGSTPEFFGIFAANLLSSITDKLLTGFVALAILVPLTRRGGADVQHLPVVDQLAGAPQRAS